MVTRKPPATASFRIHDGGREIFLRKGFLSDLGHFFQAWLLPGPKSSASSAKAEWVKGRPQLCSWRFPIPSQLLISATHIRLLIPLSPTITTVGQMILAMSGKVLSSLFCLTQIRHLGKSLGLVDQCELLPLSPSSCRQKQCGF